MKSVGIVLVSHSREIVLGLQKLLHQLQPNVPIAIAGGMDDGSLGTNALDIQKAIESVYSERGVVVFIDLGSARINAEMAIEMLENQNNVVIADAPLVEGAFVAVVEAGCGRGLHEVVEASEKAKTMKKLQT